MRHAPWLLPVLVSLVLPTAARAQCDPATYVPSCTDPSTIQLCISNTAFSVDCPTGGGDRCVPFECDGPGCETTAAACVDSEGGSCFVQGFNSGSPNLLLGCDEGGTCTRGFDGEACEIPLGETPSCSVSGNQVIGPGCDGSVSYGCLLVNPETLYTPAYAVDCADFGSQCAETANGESICWGAAGASCDDLSIHPLSLLRCQPGFECQGASAGSPGTCVAAADAGPADAGTDGGGFLLTDGGSANTDGGLVDNDGGFVGNDAGQTPVDGGQTGDDAGQMPADGGQTGTDAGGDPPIDVDAGNAFGDCAGGVTALGECDGETLRYCQAGVVEEIDCAASDRVCAEVGPTAGFNCVRPEDAPPAEGEEEPASIFCRCARPGDRVPPAVWLAFGLLALLARRRRVA